MGRLLPLFPLGTVLFPGMPLPLRVFEDRYRQLMRDLLALPEPREFGVIAIRQGREVGAGGVTSLYDTGCLATVREVAGQAGGQLRVMAEGGRRFRLGALDRSRAYLRGELELLPEETGDPGTAQAAARAVRGAFTGYLQALAERGRPQPATAVLPDEPIALSYRVASAMMIDVAERQSLLAEPDAAARLAAERALLGRETTMLRALTSAPAPDLRHAPYNPN